MDNFFNYCFELKLHRTVEVTARGSSFHQGTQQAAEFECIKYKSQSREKRDRLWREVLYHKKQKRRICDCCLIMEDLGGSTWESRCKISFQGQGGGA